MKLKSLIFISILSFLMTSFLFQSCSQDDDFMEINEQEEALRLVTPNGVKIASSIQNLKKMVSIDIAERFGTDIEFTITSIESFDLSGEYASLIDFKTVDGIKSNMLISSVPLMVGKNVSRVRTRSEGPGDITKYTCEIIEGKYCADLCSVLFDYDKWEARCNCIDECKLVEKKLK